jgi:hypothetical protein
MNTGAIASLTNTKTITGGAGGFGVPTFASGGAGGAGVTNSGAITTLTNSGEISSGSGGVGTGVGQGALAATAS